MTEDDAEAIFRMNSNPKVLKYLPGEPLLTNVDEALEAMRQRIFPQYVMRVGRWAVVLRDEKRMIGWAGLKYMPETREYDLGYRLLESHWDKGYATEAASAVLNYGRLHLGNCRIVGKAHVANLASIHVLEKIGMTFEGYEQVPECSLAVYVA
jgi:RimJ/RimL family protein N-acetyltransferase